MSDVAIEKLPPVGMISLRGELSVLGPAVEEITGCALPEMRMSTRAGDATTIWMSPDELLIVCDHGAARDLAARLTEALAEEFATVSVVSDARQMFEVRGAGAETLLQKIMPVDFDRMRPQEVRRTRMAQIPAAVWRHGGGFRLVCFRSVADYAMDLLETSRPVGG